MRKEKELPALRVADELEQLEVAANGHQVLLRRDAEPLPELTENLRAIVLELEVAHLVGRRQLAPFRRKTVFLLKDTNTTKRQPFPASI